MAVPVDLFFLSRIEAQTSLVSTAVDIYLIGSEIPGERSHPIT